MAPHSSTLPWKIPWIEEPGRLQSMGSQRVGHNWATSLSLFTFMHWRRKWQPTPVFLPRESQGWGNLVCCRLWGRTESDTTEVAAAAAVSQLPLTLCDPMVCRILSMEFSSLGYWSALPFPTPGDLQGWQKYCSFYFLKTMMFVNIRVVWSAE